ncbi:zonadhesin-like [Leptopilina boulardi]|uniref:zonadhesin-like n=1 Tax=Leptopilina boulardi TaxID=63433 RepID=UPI0021F52239|nr:zonadhesin-like [Leptopilina boulardi]XP_051166822.1 zonadhesin-like [Leptopilina boulardi]
MSSIFTLSLLLAIAAVQSYVDNCGHNAIYTECEKTSNCIKTCHEFNTSSCTSNKTCHPGCECKEGYVRHLEFNLCVLPHHCPKLDSIFHNCGPNEIYRECGDVGDCIKTCDKLDTSFCYNKTKCNRGCECIKGYVRDLESDKCVLPHQCPRKDCGPNEIYTSCRKDIDCVKACHNLNTSSCTSDKPCYPGCECKKGFVLEFQTDRCILPHQCPRYVRKQPILSFRCGPNTRINGCGLSPFCQTSCISLNHTNRRCLTDMTCHVGCGCEEGFLWDRIFHRCILPFECPIKGKLQNISKKHTATPKKNFEKRV